MQRIGKKLRDYIFERDGYACLKCGTTDNLTIDHIVPLCMGGSAKRCNLQTLCVMCNCEKDNLIIDYRKIKEPEDNTDCVGHCINSKACDILGCCVYKHELMQGKGNHWLINSRLSYDGKISTAALVNIFQEIKLPKVSGKDIWIDFAKQRGIYLPAYEYMTKKAIVKSIKKPVEQKNIAASQLSLKDAYKEKSEKVKAKRVKNLGFYDNPVKMKSALDNLMPLLPVKENIKLIPELSQMLTDVNEYQDYLQRQTLEQFQLAKQHGWRIAKMLTEPEPNFHYE